MFQPISLPGITASTKGESEMRSSFDAIWKRHFRAVLGGEKGATSIEYAILGAMIAAVIVIVVFSLGAQVRLLFETVTRNW